MRRPLAPACLALACAACAGADDRAEIHFDAREALALAAAQQPQPDASPEAPPALAFTDQSDQWWVTVGLAGGAIVGRDDAFGEGFLSFSTFIADHFEVGVEFGGWYLSQDLGEDTGAASAGLLFRWHFMEDPEGDWSIFASAGVGLLLAGEEIPGDGDGTEFNFTPTAGLGFTCRLADGPNRLIGGVRWQHISNARLAGGDENSGRDFGTLYVGVMFPF